MSFKFPWGTKEPAANKEDASIDDILPTTASRVELVLLVAICTDKMRDGLSSAFEPPAVKNQSQEPNDLLIMDDEAETKRKDLSFIRNMELNSNQMQGLKRASVTFFNAWRTAVLRRMGESLNVRSEAVKQAKTKYLSNLEAETKAKKDQDFFAWAEGRDEDLRSSNEKARDTFIYEIIHTPLLKMDEKKRALILNSCLFMLLSLENYPAHSRVLMLYLCHCLRLPVDVLSSSESTLAFTLIKSASSTEMNADEARKQKAAQDASSRKWKVGLATVGGAALLAVSGGLAAPLLLGVAGSIMGGIGLGGLATLLGATIANPVTIAALFGTLGGRMSGKAMEKYAKEVRDFQLIPVRKSDQTPPAYSPEASPSPAKHKLRVVIGISGWLLGDSDITYPWKTLSGDSFEPFALRYERKALIDLGSSLDQVLRNSAFTLAQAGAMQLVLPAIAAAMLPVSLLSTGQFLDNPFSIALERSDKAGKVLATALIAKAQGERPVTLVGFSLGARVIYSCLQELVEQNAFGLIESVVMAGSPVPSDEMAWRRMRSVVAGRFVNVYTNSDILLGFLYRTRNAQLNIAGLQEVRVEGVENKNASEFVHGHQQYRLAMGKILSEIHFDDLDEGEAQREEAELNAEDAMEKRLYQEARTGGRLRGEEDEDGRIRMVDAIQATNASIHEPNEPDQRSSIDEASVRGRFAKMDVNMDAAPLFHEKRTDPDTADEESDEDEEEEHRSQMITLDPGPEPESDDERDGHGHGAGYR